MSTARALALLIAAGACPEMLCATVQQDRLAIEQVSPRAGAGVPQIAAPQRPSARPPPQLAADQESTPAASQLTSERGAARVSSQVTSASRSAEPPQSLSHRNDGRSTAVERLEGSDRCDPAIGDKTRSRKCADVIENRAAEFSRPDPTALSPEQRLLLEQELREGALDFQAAARRLANTGESDSLEAQGVASVVLTPSAESNKPDKPEDDAAADAAAIVGAVVNQPPQ